MIINLASGEKRRLAVGSIGVLHLGPTPKRWVPRTDYAKRLQKVKAAQRRVPITVTLFPKEERKTYLQLIDAAVRRVAENSATSVDVGAKIALAWEQVGRAVHEGLKTEIKRANEHGARAGE